MFKKIILGIGLSSAIMIVGCHPEQKKESVTPAVGIRTKIVSYTRFIQPVRCSGQLSTKTESRLSFKTGGIIYRILADEGQLVSEGQLLAELNLEEVQSQVSQANLVLRKSERDFRRAENLYRDSVVTLEKYENAKTALDVARANDRIARFNLKYSTIHAPTDGKILKRVAEPNEMIAPGHPVFLFASTRNDWVVRANLTDRDIVKVHMLDSATIHFDAYPEEEFAGIVSEIGMAADPYTGTYEIEIRLSSVPGKLVSGFMARIKIFPSGDEQKMIIPFESLIEGAGLSAYVFVIEDGKLQRRKISIDSNTDQGIIVSEGLREGEELVVEGTQYLREGSQIEIIK